jgi:hypothetical protein
MMRGGFSTRTCTGSGNMKKPLKVMVVTFSVLGIPFNATLGQGRTVAVHSGRAVAGLDIVLMTPREFVIPREVGTIWNYQYRDENGEFGKLERWGFHTWTLTSKSITGTDTILQIRDVESDSLRWWVPTPLPATYQVDTVYFAVVISADSILFSFPEPKADAFDPVVPAVPRYSMLGSDTLSMQIGDGYRGAIVKYANHVGMFYYGFYFAPGITSAFTEMDLISFVPIVNSAFEPRTQMPAECSLLQNYPNPFNPSTTIRYALPRRSRVTLSVYNTLGQVVAPLVQEEQEPGYHDVRFDASGLASGVYFYRLTAGSFVETRKLMILR